MRFFLAFLISLATSVAALAQDPVKVDPAHYHVLFENAHMGVLEYRDKPGDKAPMHSHASYMTYVAGPGKTKIALPNGPTFVEEDKGSGFDCQPVLVGQFEFLGRTPDAHLRHTRFMGLREDKNAEDVTREMQS